MLAVVGGSLGGSSRCVRKGWIDDVLMRIADLTLGMPVILLGLVLVAAFGSSIVSLVLILGDPLRACDRAAGAFGDPGRAGDRTITWRRSRSVRGRGGSWSSSCCRTRCRCCSRAARSSRPTRSSSRRASASSALGVQPPTASWGTLCCTWATRTSTARTGTRIFPGLVILIAVLALNTLGDNLQRVLDPRADDGGAPDRGGRRPRRAGPRGRVPLAGGTMQAGSRCVFFARAAPAAGNRRRVGLGQVA